MKGIYALAGDTDGVDGSEDNAGALIYPDTLARAAKAGINAKAMLADNDPWTFFNAIGDLLVTGPTLTNVNDFRAPGREELSNVGVGSASSLSRC